MVLLGFDMSSTASAIAAQVVVFLRTNRISQTQLLMLVEHASVEREDAEKLRRTAQQLYSEDGHGPNEEEASSLEEIASVLQDTFGFDLDESRIPRVGRRFRAHLARFVGVVLAASTFYFVLGGIAAGESSLTLLYGAPIWLAFTILLLALLLLGSLEGTQIAIVALTDKKVASFSKRHPRGCRAIKMVQSKSEVERYLAGRQFFVIFVVFVIAQVTSFPQIDVLPFTEIQIGSLPQVVIFLGFKLGLFGALLVLWVAQLLPQFVANKNPLLFLDLLGMPEVIRMCLLLESVGPTKPASWLAAAQREELIVPTAAFVKHDNVADDVFGYDIVNQNYIWTLHSADRWSLEYTSAIGIRTDGISRLREKSLLLHGVVEQTQFDNQVYRQGDAQSGLITTPGVESTPQGSGWTHFEQEVTGNKAFENGDVVQSTYRLEGRGFARLAHAVIAKPTRLVSFRVRVHAAALSGQSLMVRKQTKDDITVTAQLVSSHTLSFSKPDQDGFQEAVFIDVHPKMNVFYDLEWQVESTAARGDASSASREPGLGGHFLIQDLRSSPFPV